MWQLCSIPSCYCLGPLDLLIVFLLAMQMLSWGTLRQQWRLEVQALGPQRKEHWPKPPPSSQPPSEMYNVDTRKLRGMIIAALAQSQLGRSLFARDIRRVSNS